MKRYIGVFGVLLVAVVAIAGTAAMPVANAAGVPGSGSLERESCVEKERGLMMDILLCEQRERELKAQRSELARQLRRSRCPVVRSPVAAKADAKAKPVEKGRIAAARLRGGVPAKSPPEKKAAAKKTGDKADLKYRYLEKRYEKLMSELIALKEKRIHDRLVAHKQLDIARAQAYDCQRSLSECGRLRAEALEKPCDVTVSRTAAQDRLADDPRRKLLKGSEDINGAVLADILLARQRTLLMDGQRLKRGLTAQKECLDRLSSRIRQVQDR